jgi:hypothetical protein
MWSIKAAGLLLILSIMYLNYSLSQEFTSDRPGFGETANITPKDHFQIEYGMSLDNTSGITDLSLLSNLYRYGISNNFEFRLAHGVTLANLKSAGGFDRSFQFSDIEIGGKYSLLNSDLQAAIIAHLILPLGSAEVSNKKLGMITKLVLSHDVVKDVSMGYTLWYENPGSGKGDISAVASLGISLTEKFGVFTEFYCSFPELNSSEFGYDNGLTYLLKENLQIDFSFGFGINQRNNFYAVGVCWRIPK